MLGGLLSEFSRKSRCKPMYGGILKRMPEQKPSLHLLLLPFIFPLSMALIGGPLSFLESVGYDTDALGVLLSWPAAFGTNFGVGYYVAHFAARVNTEVKPTAVHVATYAMGSAILSFLYLVIPAFIAFVVLGPPLDAEASSLAGAFGFFFLLFFPVYLCFVALGGLISVPVAAVMLNRRQLAVVSSERV